MDIVSISMYKHIEEHFNKPHSEVAGAPETNAEPAGGKKRKRVLKLVVDGEESE